MRVIILRTFPLFFLLFLIFLGRYHDVIVPKFLGEKLIVLLRCLQHLSLELLTVLLRVHLWSLGSDEGGGLLKLEFIPTLTFLIEKFQDIPGARINFTLADDTVVLAALLTVQKLVFDSIVVFNTVALDDGIIANEAINPMRAIWMQIRHVIYPLELMTL